MDLGTRWHHFPIDGTGVPDECPLPEPPDEIIIDVENGTVSGFTEQRFPEDGIASSPPEPLTEREIADTLRGLDGTTE